MDLAWNREAKLGLDLNEEPMEGIDVDYQPTPIVELPQTYENVQLLSNLDVEHSLEFSIAHVMNMQSFMND